VVRNRVIDLHAHVLPGVDDGPATLIEALDMLRLMAQQGLQTVVATAHALDGKYNATRDMILRGTEALNVSAAAANIGVRVLPSMEVYLGFDTIQSARRGELVGLNDSKYLVVELPHGEFPAYTERALFELLMAGYRPILNHPERNLGIRRNPDRMYRLAEQGLGAMVTAASLLGRFGADAEELAQEFLLEGVAELVVSDAHNLSGRSPNLPDGLILARDYGKRDQSAEAHLLSQIS
jgi:protein-tyrosine phosphatase